MTKNKAKFSKAEIITKFNDVGISLKVKKDINHGVQLTFDNGAKINVFKTGNISLQGKDVELSDTIIYNKSVSTVEDSKRSEYVNQDENLGDNIDTINDDLPPW